MGALGAAISGLQSSQRWLDVISNNVSNSNTVAYKASRVTFSDLVNQGLRSASGSSSSSNLGGINPSQLGLGVTVQTIQTIFQQGSVNVTGNATDLAIQGAGFFTVAKGDATVYTRSGNFTFDSAGNMVTADGGLVQGWMGTFTRTNSIIAPFRINTASYTLNTQDVTQIGNIQIPADLIIAPKATSANQNTSIKDQGVIISGNLDERSPGNTAAVATLTAAGFIASGGAGTGAVAIPGGIDPSIAHTLVPDPFANITADHTITQTVYDSVGDPRSITFLFYQVGDTAGIMPPQFAWYAFDTTTVSGSAIFTGAPTIQNLLGGSGLDLFTAATWLTAASIYAPAVGTTPEYGFISFNADGSLQTNGGYGVPAAGGLQPNPVLALINPFNAPTNTAPTVLPSGGLDPFIFSVNFGTGNTFGAGAAIATTGGFSDPVTNNGLRDGLTGDYGGGSIDPVTGIYIPNSTATSTFQDGYSDGQLLSLSVDQTGQIIGTFTNQQSLAIAQLAMANFTNPGGLSKIGDSYFSSTSNSGQARFDTAGSNGMGAITGGALEGSNVDLTLELTNMIIAQRMFESNARVVTAADRVLDTLVNLGR